MLQSQLQSAFGSLQTAYIANGTDLYSFLRANTGLFLQVRIDLEGFWKEWESQPKISTGARMVSKKQRRTALAHC